MNSDNLYDVITSIRRISGLNNKKALLKACPELKNILRTTYDPFIHFNVTAMPSWQLHTGEKVFDASVNQLLNLLSTGFLSGNRAKSAIKNKLETLTWKSGQLLICIINKNMDMGLGAKSINDVFPDLIPLHNIQLAKLFDITKCRFPCFTSPKLDGLRAKNTDGKFRSRQGHIFQGLTKLEEELEYIRKELNLPNLAFDGELIVPGQHFNEISGDIRSFKEVDSCQYYIFDIPQEALEQASRLYFLNGLYQFQTDRIRIVPHVTVMSHDEIMDKHNEYRDLGYEGSIIKQEHGLYEGARSNNWMKIKDTLTFDCKVVGMYAGQGKYTGACGGIVIDFNGINVRVGSGLTDLQRFSWFTDDDDIIGKTVEVACQEITPDGSMRHPRLIKVRGDK